MNNIFVDALPNENIEVTFESGEFKRPEGRDGMSRNTGIGLSGGGRRGGMREGNRGIRRDMQKMMETINFSFDIKLSSNK